MSNEQTVATLPDSYREVMNDVIADYCGTDYPDIMDAWREHTAVSLHELGTEDELTVGEIEELGAEVIAFAAGWRRCVSSRDTR